MAKKNKFVQKEREAKTLQMEPSWSDPSNERRGSSQSVMALDLAEGERLNDEGVRLLNNQRFAEAEQQFKAAIAAAPLIPAGHNNLALAVYVQGRIDEAIRIQEDILKRVPMDNVFGMSNLVQLYLTAGRVADAKVIADKTLRLKPFDTGALVKQCEALARLSRHQDILHAVKRYSGELDGSVYYFAGMASANLGRFDRALDFLQLIHRKDLYGERAAKYIGRIKAGRGPETIEGNWPYFKPQDILPNDVFQKLILKLEGAAQEKSDLVKNPIIVDMTAAWLNEYCDKKTGDMLIGLLGHMKHPGADDLLKQIAEGTFGNDELRLCAYRTLVSKGVWDSNISRKIWVKGKWIEVKTQESAVTTEAESAPMPEGLSSLYEKATVAMHRGRWVEGEKLWRELLVKAPDFHPAYHNLAIALIQQKRNAEAETCLRKAMELDPNYVFAPCTLTTIYLREGRTNEARELIDTVIVPDKIHPSAMAAYCSAQCQVAITEKDVEKAIGWLDLGAKVDPGNRSIKELKKSLRIPRYLEKILSKLRSRAEKEKRLRRKRVLSKDGPLAECYAMYSAEELAGMARAVGIDPKSLQKEDTLSAICAVLENAESVQLIQRHLLPEEKTALQEVMNAGGRMDYETFTRAHGSDADDAFGWGKQPQSLLGRLKCRGLLVEATVDRRPSVFIPSRIRLTRE